VTSCLVQVEQPLQCLVFAKGGRPVAGGGTLRQALCRFLSIKLSRGPIGTEQLGLLENGVGGFLLLVGRIAAFSENPLDHDAELRPDGFFGRPVDGDVPLDRLHEFLGDGAW